MFQTHISIGSLLAALASINSVQAEVRRFADPKMGGDPVSYCAAAGEVCGERVADSWCRSQGFQSAVDWSVRLGRDAATRTRAIDSEVICRGAHCESFASISCETSGQAFRMPALGGLSRSTIITPSRRSAEVAFAAVEYEVLIPGCHQREPGIFLCESVHEYQHCRTLFRAGRVFGCRAGLAFDGGFAEPLLSAPEEHRLELESNASATVYRERRGEGKLRGEVRLAVSFDLPTIDAKDWCLQRDRYIYFPSGPKGGLAEIDATDDCDVPIEARFAPHEDDLIEAYDLCEGSASWDAELEASTDLMVAGLFHIGSARPEFNATYGPTRIVAPYMMVKAPLQIICKD